MPTTGTVREGRRGGKKDRGKEKISENYPSGSYGAATRRRKQPGGASPAAAPLDWHRSLMPAKTIATPLSLSFSLSVCLDDNDEFYSTWKCRAGCLNWREVLVSRRRKITVASKVLFSVPTSPRVWQVDIKRNVRMARCVWPVTAFREFIYSREIASTCGFNRSRKVKLP